MRKFYLLPISLFLMSQAFSNSYSDDQYAMYEESYEEEFADHEHQRAVERRDYARRAQAIREEKAQQAQQRRTSPYTVYQNQGRNAPQPMSQQQQQNAPRRNYNSAARPVVQDGMDMWLSADLLVWQATEENLTYVVSGDLNKPFDRDLHTLEFDWHCGFRLGMGYNSAFDSWDLAFYYTRIKNFAFAEKSATTNNGLFPFYSGGEVTTPGTITSASSNWQALLNQIDLDLGREFYVGKYLTLQPFVGVRSTWIQQEQHITLRSAPNLVRTKTRTELESNFWGFGFVAGFNTDWLFGKGFSLYANADYSILLGYFDTDQEGKISGGDRWSIDRSFRVGRSILDLAMGLKWAALFCNDRYGFALKAGYEYHLYFDQNQITANMHSSTGDYYNPIQGNLIYQGFTFSMQFDF